METSIVYKIHTCKITFADIPETVDLDDTIEHFSHHSYHLGAWNDSLPENNLTERDRLPPVNKTSHIVRDVAINDEGGLSITFEIINSPRGFSLAKQYDTDNFKMVPVMDENLINIYRFDFVKEE